MAVQIINDDVADAAIVNGVSLPVNAGLVGYFEHWGGSLTQARTNLVDGSLAAIVGSPVAASDGVTMTTNTHFLQTALPETDAYTIFSIANIGATPDGTSAGAFGLIGNFRSGSGGTQFYVRGPASGSAPAGRITSLAYVGASVAVTHDLALADVTGWRMRAVRFTPGSGLTTFALTSGGKVTTSNVNSRTKNALDNIAIGGRHQSTVAGVCKHGLSVIYATALTDAQIETDMATALREIAAAAGITV
ncbi:MAG: hypothetical protein K2X46_11045 [Roseomonas sp.]|nr:hypothetical protein [Roseomonas sp.]